MRYDFAGDSILVCGAGQIHLDLGSVEELCLKMGSCVGTCRSLSVVYAANPKDNAVESDGDASAMQGASNEC